jgi:hypothetical protein
VSDPLDESPEALASRRAREAREKARTRQAEEPKPKRFTRRGIVAAVLLGLAALRMLERTTAPVRR